MLTLPDKSKISLSPKTVEVTGLMSSVKNFNTTGSIEFKDITNKITSIVSFDAQQKKRTGYWTSWVKGSDKVNKDSGVLDNRRDLVNIII